MTESLDETMTGRWLVATQESEHVWDLDAKTVTQKRGSGSGGGFIGDSEELEVLQVHMWPTVGQASYIVVKIPSSGEFQWRQSSTIREIEELS